MRRLVCAILATMLLCAPLLGCSKLVQETPDNPAASGDETATPVYGDQVADGTYQITVDSSVPAFFNIVYCTLTVKDGEMTAVMALHGRGYDRVFMGTGEEAESASESDYSFFVQDEAGLYTYEVPVEALDVDTACAAFSIKRQKWYDRTLVFQSDGIPADCITR